MAVKRIDLDLAPAGSFSTAAKQQFAYDVQFSSLSGGTTTGTLLFRYQVTKSNRVVRTSRINIEPNVSVSRRRINVARIVYASSVQGTSIPTNALLNEDGTPLLTEDGQYILVE